MASKLVWNLQFFSTSFQQYAMEELYNRMHVTKDIHQIKLHTEEEVLGIVEGVPVHPPITVLIARMDFIKVVDSA